MTNRIANNTLVSAGQNIGRVSGLDGSGNNTVPPHLHFDYFADGVYPNNPDNQAQSPAVVICHVSNLGISSVNTHSQGTLSLTQWCQKHGVTR
jgi:murein DD-endopeptidase MepM/ murein hydrolase activator NlpD